MPQATPAREKTLDSSWMHVEGNMSYMGKMLPSGIDEPDSQDEDRNEDEMEQEDEEGGWDKDDADKAQTGAEDGS